MTFIFILCCGGIPVALGHHNFWRSHGDLANLMVGGLIVVGTLQAAVSIWSHSRTTRDDR